jgi:predicted dehydrogenase
MGGGFTTDWGAHMFDSAQWGLGMDRNGPVKAAPIGDGSEFMQFEYDSGVVLTSETFDERKTKGVKFWGDAGWLEVSRGHYKASDDSLLPADSGAADDTPYETKIPHQINFIEAIKNRVDPVVPVEVGHSSCTMCTIGNIACELGREVIWDPKAESFGNDEAAVAMMHYNYREPWKL